MIRVVILGAGTAIPLIRYSPAGNLVQAGNTLILVDIGPGTLARLATAGVDYRDLNHILITHHHSDHTLDLVTLIQAFDSTPGWRRQDALHLIGGKGTTQFFDQLMVAFPGIGPTFYPLEIHELEQDSLVFQNWMVRSALTNHTDNSLGYRLEVEGRSIVFSGDAANSQELVQLADQADIFVCECSYPGNSTPGDHLSAGQVGLIAHRAGVKRLILVHLYPQTLAADLAAQVGEAYPGPVEIAHDGLEIYI